ncbi:cell death-inducing p53-target protein 1 [Drosophila biarmipes]|uniref:cell death-inducing p53-target protein 1 n=1 Tax=Drosophila biarmipes TaxID=125945 RepID=UPI0007E78D99|nr:cell death-inducing p53-target protein 1 [Drosophila biarmipes]
MSLQLSCDRPATPPPSYSEAMGWDPPGSSRLTPQDFTGRTSILTICSKCLDEIETTTVTRRGNAAYVASFIVMLTTCGLGCWLLPCIINGFNEVHHTCPSCKASLGIVRL